MIANSANALQTFAKEDALPGGSRGMTDDSIEFEGGRISRSQRRLWLGDAQVHLGGRAFDLLLALVQHRDRLVSARELIEAVWPDVVVESNNLRVQISALRKLLGPSALLTVPGRGYRFTLPVLNHPGAPAPPPVHLPGGNVAAVWAGNLPVVLPRLFGRDEDQRQVQALLDTHRLVTIVGAGGIGKTRLALAAAHAARDAWADGVWLVELSASGDGGAVANEVARTLQIARGEDAGDALRWVAALAGRAMLLVLDNCEHQVGALRALAARILADAPGVHLLVTSQVPLDMPEEQRLRLAPLSVPDAGPMAAEQARAWGAVALFEARAQAVDWHFKVRDDNVAAVVEICRRLDGLPLAIELAAARVPLLGLSGLRERLEHRLQWLTGGRAMPLPRHQTLTATLAWSHGLLDEREQLLFRRLGAFAGGFTLELAQAALNDDMLGEWELLDLLGSLVSRSLIEVDAADPPRYMLLDSAREFALEKLAEAGESEWMRRRHALAMTRQMSKLDRDRRQGLVSIDALVGRVAEELENFRVAVRWSLRSDARIEVALPLLVTLWPPMRFFGLSAECLQWMLELETSIDDRVPPELRAGFAVGVGTISGRGLLGARRRVDLLIGAEKLFRELGDLEYLVGTLNQLSKLHGALGDVEAALAYALKQRALTPPHWPGLYRAAALQCEATARAMAGAPSAAHALYHELHPLLDAEGDEQLRFLLLIDVGELELLLGLFDEAAQRFSRLVASARLRRLPGDVTGPLLIHLTAALTAQGRNAQARATAGEAVAQMRLLGQVAEGCHFYARLAAREGRWADAGQLVGAGDAQRRRAGETRYLFEPQARSAACRLIAEACGQAQLDDWRRQGGFLDERALLAMAAGLRV
jgi:predicted ATPase/DNA-binding winged helix-turn-helix (wHTH) protein